MNTAATAFSDLSDAFKAKAENLPANRPSPRTMVREMLGSEIPYSGAIHYVTNMLQGMRAPYSKEAQTEWYETLSEIFDTLDRLEDPVESLRMAVRELHIHRIETIEFPEDHSYLHGLCSDAVKHLRNADDLEASGCGGRMGATTETVHLLRDALVNLA